MPGLIILISVIVCIVIIYLYFNNEAISETTINDQLKKKDYYYRTKCNIKFLYSTGGDYDVVHKFKMILYAYDFGILLIRDSKQTYGPYSIFFVKNKIYKEKFPKVKVFGLVNDCRIIPNSIILNVLAYERIPKYAISKEFVVELEAHNELLLRLIEFTNE